MFTGWVVRKGRDGKSAAKASENSFGPSQTQVNHRNRRNRLGTKRDRNIYGTPPLRKLGRGSANQSTRCTPALLFNISFEVLATSSTVPEHHQQQVFIVYRGGGACCRSGAKEEPTTLCTIFPRGSGTSLGCCLSENFPADEQQATTAATLASAFSRRRNGQSQLA